MKSSQVTPHEKERRSKRMCLKHRHHGTLFQHPQTENGPIRRDYRD
ncbi:hypothetical protein RSSM_00591 [Rhodopirellula sallentina SM41]|uniref:Uncharacterized protein n=1 Tax=Rhodopirellula sallentina SM41 TaxID=1263870 RepID=M5UJC7_9BACT|nr:hypothetical protein RSSM_00591 [Rhodopirellula sallentina SM41]